MTLSIGCWQAPPHQLDLGAGQLHLWRIPLNLPSGCAEDLKAFLNAEELSRAIRLRIVAKKHEFIIARARLRQILAGYLGTDPVAIEFCYGQHGKPSLSTSLPRTLHFNLSHSGNWALLAISKTGDLGVDLEQQDKRLDFQKLAAQFFTAEEIQRLNSLAEQRQRRGFYRLWTLKEAQLKALGHGFSFSAEKLPAAVNNQCRSFPIARNYLAAISFSAETTSIMRYQATDR